MGPVLPTIRAMVLADRVYRDGTTGKHVIAGTFNSISAQVFPAAWTSGAAIYFAMHGFRGQTTLSLTFREASTRVAIIGIDLEIDTKDALQVVEGSIPIPPFPINHPGTYEFELSMGGTFLADIKLYVEELK